MDLLVAHQNYVVGSSTDQGPSDGRDIRNGSFSSVSKRLAATVVALERYPMPERNCFELNRRWDDLSGPQTISEISHFAGGERDRAATFV